MTKRISMVLNFIKKINGFEKQHKANKASGD